MLHLAAVVASLSAGRTPHMQQQVSLSTDSSQMRPLGPAQADLSVWLCLNDWAWRHEREQEGFRVELLTKA
jgi:hypothetical protein